MKDLPSPAQTIIKETAGNDQILRVAKETRKGKECYDAVVNKNRKEVAIRVDSNSKFMGTHPEKASAVSNISAIALRHTTGQPSRAVK